MLIRKIDGQEYYKNLRGVSKDYFKEVLEMVENSGERSMTFFSTKDLGMKLYVEKSYLENHDAPSCISKAVLLRHFCPYFSTALRRIIKNDSLVHEGILKKIKNNANGSPYRGKRTREQLVKELNLRGAIKGYTSFYFHQNFAEEIYSNELIKHMHEKGLTIDTMEFFTKFDTKKLENLIG